MTHHTWKDRFKTALHNKNWKKIIFHETIEYAWLGSWVIHMQGEPLGWLVGISGAFIIHMVVFEAIDALHRKTKKNIV